MMTAFFGVSEAHVESSCMLIHADRRLYHSSALQPNYPLLIHADRRRVHTARSHGVVCCAALELACHHCTHGACWAVAACARHHWSDVLVGSLIGQCGAWVGYRMRFPSPWAEGVRLIPHVMRAEEWRKEHGSPPALGV